ncbi:hypothetical protein COEREDRAFT_9907 [Coemansia reversa NRRL 1564]|uniref:Uncharacterized protein n=1 Tax=Coemansia reversa (strain ATCC 12441 / NRRL 1564) TaxID=763665 RepID=A0A2G5B753_COERN|nr:hypothetical protein COEREDRAFT_9907 [Coemansia reversa NRRL 1564]|eukprot:PIA14830.1 hypothetical protein COEREDRAFT_9907 [Coemansia reversa NRRL 1564]
MPVSATADNILHKTIHDRYSSTRSSGERAILSLALQAFAEVQLRRQETTARVCELSMQIQCTESQMSRLQNRIFNHTSINAGALDKYSVADIRVLESLANILAGQERRLRATKEELNSAETRLSSIVSTWATSRF